MAVTPQDHNTNSFIEWLSTQWYFLTALAAGAFHAGISHFKIIKHDEQLKAMEQIPDRLARIETHLEHLLEKFTKH